MPITNSAFQHVRQLDLGVVSKNWNPVAYLAEQLFILEIFARRRTLTHLWLSRFPFHSIPSSQLVTPVKIQDVITTFGLQSAT
jgi:hypothetical protein